MHQMQFALLVCEIVFNKQLIELFSTEKKQQQIISDCTTGFNNLVLSTNRREAKSMRFDLNVKALNLTDVRP